MCARIYRKFPRLLQLRAAAAEAAAFKRAGLQVRPLHVIDSDTKTNDTILRFWQEAFITNEVMFRVAQNDKAFASPKCVRFTNFEQF